MSQTGNKKYWRGFEELTEDPAFEERKNKEFSEYIPVEDFLSQENVLADSGTSRRDFLKFLGFGVTAASLAACETPVTRAIPYVVKPEEITPGIANWYASTYFDGNDYSSVLVKTREGRPILIEGNKLSSVSNGAINARINSSVLMLYDSNRIQQPIDKEGNAVQWSAVDEAVINALKGAVAKSGKIRILSNTIISPSTQAAIDGLTSKYGGEEGADVKHVVYDTVSYSGIVEANEASFGKGCIPGYRFDKASTIVSIGADFLSTWLSSVEYAGQYVKNRKPEENSMSRHYQFETGLSLTGSNADYRYMIKPSETGQVVRNLYNAIASQTGNSTVSGGNDVQAEAIKSVAANLINDKKRSLVVCGSNQKEVQILVNGINNMLGNYGRTIDLYHHSNLRMGKDVDVKMLCDEMNSGSVNALIICGGNPAGTLPKSLKFNEGMANVEMSVSTCTYRNETTELCNFTGPDNHFLESWNDANPVPGKYSLAQPTISKLYDTRQCQESLLNWSGYSMSYVDFMKEYWNENLFPLQSESVVFTQFWNKIVHDGVFEPAHKHDEEEELVFKADISAASSGIKGGSDGEYELFLYQKTGIGDGTHANNPLLQEMPDPVTKITWDNYVTMAPEDMAGLDYNMKLGQQEKANMITVTSNGVTSEALPVVAQPGQTPGTLGIALGYGKKAWKQSQKIGADAYCLTSFNGFVQYFNGATIMDTGEHYHLAATQTSHTVMGRESVIKETTLDTYNEGDRDAYNPVLSLATHSGREAVKDITLWESHEIESTGFQWGLSIDLNSCIGCGSCVTACSAENNVPIVGKDEVRRSREMQWIRIDRYYSTDADLEDKSIGGYRDMEVPSNQPEVVFQPMMCQHCNHAPCETVCPVAATTHSSEGLNMMAYNRCIGTRYCANNCPYKVRRFNWFSYVGDSKFTDTNPSQDDMGRMVLNPDVVVRSRGVIEKCSMCVQRIQAGKLEAKKMGNKVQDGAISTACASACPTNAITFGDLNDKETRVAKAAASDRAYRVIEEVGTKPNVVYQTKVRNKDKAEA